MKFSYFYNLVFITQADKAYLKTCMETFFPEGKIDREAILELVNAKQTPPISEEDIETSELLSLVDHVKEEKENTSLTVVKDIGERIRFTHDNIVQKLAKHTSSYTQTFHSLQETLNTLVNEYPYLTKDHLKTKIDHFNESIDKYLGQIRNIHKNVTGLNFLRFLDPIDAPDYQTLLNDKCHQESLDNTFRSLLRRTEDMENHGVEETGTWLDDEEDTYIVAFPTYSDSAIPLLIFLNEKLGLEGFLYAGNGENKMEFRLLNAFKRESETIEETGLEVVGELNKKEPRFRDIVDILNHLNLGDDDEYLSYFGWDVINDELLEEEEEMSIYQFD